MRTRLVLCMTGVLGLDLICTGQHSAPREAITAVAVTTRLSLNAVLSSVSRFENAADITGSVDSFGPLAPPLLT